MDNHPAHHSNKTQAWLKDNEIKILWIPTYASELNPIEWVWKLFKDKWHKDIYRRYLAPDAPLNRTET